MTLPLVTTSSPNWGITGPGIQKFNRLSISEFTTQRQSFDTQYFPCPGATKTICVSSHIWWSEMIGLACRNLGYNVLFSYALYLLYVDPNMVANFPGLWQQTIDILREYKVDLLLGGNTTAMAVNPTTRKMLHDEVGIPLINYWWDEPRCKPPFAKDCQDQWGSFTIRDYLDYINNPQSTNLFWDLDVMEEMQETYGIKNCQHLPLATTPEIWPQEFIPLQQRQIALCFLGNCHANCMEVETSSDPLVQWANRVVLRKIQNVAVPMMDCLRAEGPPPASSRFNANTTDEWERDFTYWWQINNAFMHHTRNKIVVMAHQALQGYLALWGKNWERVGIKSQGDHALENSGLYYNQSRGSLNLAGGCVHGGLPLRPYDIAASNGLIVSHATRELDALYVPGKECLSFHNSNELLRIIEMLLKNPAEFTDIVHAGHQRTCAEHSWEKRLEPVLSQVLS